MQNNSALRLVNSAAAEAALQSPRQDAARKRAARTPSPAQQLAQQRLTLLAQTYTHVLNDSQRLAYKTLGQSYPVGKSGSTAARDVFVALNSCRLQAGMDILLDVGPFTPMLPPSPQFDLTGTISAQGIFALDLNLDLPFSSLYTLSATRPLSPGVMEIPRAAYQFVESGQPAGVLVLHAADGYSATFGRIAPAGTRVGVCLTPLTAQGFPGLSVFRDVLVSGA